MKRNRWFASPNPVLSHVRVAIAVALVFAAGTMCFLAAKTSGHKSGGEIALAPLLAEFGQRGWNRVMIEGGAHLAASALRQKMVDRIAFFVAPKILGGGLSAIEGLRFLKVKDSISLDDLEVWQIGKDLLIEARVIY